MKSLIKLLCILSLCIVDSMGAMNDQAKTQQVASQNISDSCGQLPLLFQGRILDTLDGKTLRILGRGLLEQDNLVREKRMLAKHLIKAAAGKPNPDAQALYLCGKTVSSASLGYIPAMYMCGINWLEESLNTLSVEQRKLLTNVITDLKRHALPEEYTLPLLQNKAVRSGCSTFTFDPSTQTCITIPDLSCKKSPQTACSMFKKLINIHIRTHDIVMEPWFVRACYAVYMIQKAGICCTHSHHPTAGQQFRYLAFAAHKQFEPAIWDLIHLQVDHDPIMSKKFETRRLAFIDASNYLQHYVNAAPITSDAIEQIINESLIVVHFLEDFGHYIPYAHLFMNANRSMIGALEKIIKLTGDYKARCILTLEQLKINSKDSIKKAFAYLEPVITDKRAQLFFAHHSSKALHEKLKNKAETDSDASFMLGLILFANQDTRLQAYKYFAMGAQKNHFYSLYSMATMIRKGFDQEKTSHDAMNYYKQALTMAPTPTLKTIVMQAIQSMAQEKSIPAQCEYLILLLDDPSSLKICSEIVKTIEELPQPEFDLHIDYLKTYCAPRLRNMAEGGNGIASRLLGYIHYAKAQGESLNLFELHISLGKLRTNSLSARSSSLAASIAYTLACHYQQSGNIKNALRLFTVAANYNHPKAQSICALSRLKQGTGSSLKQDLKLAIQLADQDDLEAQDFLVKLYCGEIKAFDTHKIKPDLNRTFRYLENILTNNKADSAACLLLAKLLCSHTEKNSIKQDDMRAYNLFMQAIQLGHTLTKEEHKQFGTLAYRLHQDVQALKSLEQCDQDKTTLWLRSILYLRSIDNQAGQLLNALDCLESVLLIENDTLQLPKEGALDWPIVWHALHSHLHDEEQAPELFVRLCCAVGLDHIPAQSSEVIELVKQLADSHSASAWSFTAFLHRHGIWLTKSLRDALKYLIAVFNHSDLSRPHFLEAQEQTKIMANLPVNFTNKKEEEITHAITACHLLTTLLMDESPLQACKYFTLADSTTISLYTANDPILILADKIGSIQCVTEYAQHNSLDAAIALITFWGNRFLKNFCSAEQVLPWLLLSDRVISSEASHYIIGQNTERDTLLAIALNVIGTIKIKFIGTENIKESLQFMFYFEYALKLDPLLIMAKYNLAYLSLHYSQSLEQCRIGLQYMRDLADTNMADACYELGILYLPNGQSKNKHPLVNPDRSIACSYLKKACDKGHPKAQTVLASLASLKKARKICSRVLQENVIISPSLQSPPSCQDHTSTFNHFLSTQLAIALTNEQWDMALQLSDMIIQTEKIPLIALGAAEIELTHLSNVPNAVRYLLKALTLVKSVTDKEFRSLFDDIFARILSSKDPMAQKLAQIVQVQVQKLEETLH